MLKCSFYTSSCHEWVTILHNKGILLVYEEFLRNPYCFCLVIYFGSLDGICVVGKAHAVEMCKNKHSLNVFQLLKLDQLDWNHSTGHLWPLQLTPDLLTWRASSTFSHTHHQPRFQGKFPTVKMSLTGHNNYCNPRQILVWGRERDDCKRKKRNILSWLEERIKKMKKAHVQWI